MSSTSNSMDKCAHITISFNAIIKNSLANGTMTNMDANRIRNMLIKIKTNTELLNSINNFNNFFLMLHAHSASSSSVTSNTDATSDDVMRPNA